MTNTSKLTPEMVINDALEILNDLVKKFDDTRVTDYTKFHNDVAAAVNPILKPIGLAYFAWAINVESTRGIVFSVAFERKLDKNATHTMRGRILSFRFILEDQVTGILDPEVDSIDAIKSAYDIITAGTNIDSYNDQINTRLDEIEKLKDRRAELRTARATAKGELARIRRTYAAPAPVHVTGGGPNGVNAMATGPATVVRELMAVEPEENIDRDQLALLNLTDLETSFLVALVNGLYAEPHFSDLDVSDVAKEMGVPVASAKGVLGSLVKKGILSTEDSGTGFDLIYLNAEHFNLHREWRKDAYDGVAPWKDSFDFNQTLPTSAY
jgi:hypothetical protein